jgi:hypothetical protein
LIQATSKKSKEKDKKASNTFLSFCLQASLPCGSSANFCTKDNMESPLGKKRQRTRTQKGEKKSATEEVVT